MWPEEVNFDLKSFTKGSIGSKYTLPCAAPDLSTELDSDVKVCINHGSKSSKLLSPIPLTIAPNARADTLRT